MGRFLYRVALVFVLASTQACIVVHTSSSTSSFSSKSSGFITPQITFDVQSLFPTVTGRWESAFSLEPSSRHEQTVMFLVRQEKSVDYSSRQSDKFFPLLHSVNSADFSLDLDSDFGLLSFNRELSSSKSGDFHFTPSLLGQEIANTYFGNEVPPLFLLRLMLKNVSTNVFAAFSATGIKCSQEEFFNILNSGSRAEDIVEFRNVEPYSVADIIRLRNSGIKPLFARQLKSAGFAFSVDDLILLHNSGVRPDEAIGWKNLGYHFSAKELTVLRNGGVTFAFAEGFQQPFPKISKDELIKFRNAGVKADFATIWQKSSQSYSPDEIVRLRNAGVSTSYVRVNVEGRKPLPVDRIIQLHNKGLSADEIVALRE
ncbi:MAG: hypothetical protein JWN25_3198 [Verrucomicrobiales bacterium]|nr:hypothetical protein [Verrucomicrobiales bacterium]